MKRRRKNNYVRKRKRSSILGGITSAKETKGSVKSSVTEMAKDLIIGVGGGGFAGAAIGRASLVAGAAVSTLGYYTKNRLATAFGFGMMAANGFQKKEDGVSGHQAGVLNGVKERVSAFKDTFSEKLYLDKIPGLKKKENYDEMMGEVQYFLHPDNPAENFNQLDQIEQQLINSANSVNGRSQSALSGHLGSMSDISLDDTIL